MMTLYLTDDQAKTVKSSLECKARTLRDERKSKAPEIVSIIDAELFQIELLVTYFERAEEMKCT